MAPRQRVEATSSSDDEDVARFASVAVSGDAVHQQALDSAQAARERHAAALRRRAGGGGLRGLAAAGGDSDADDDAGEVRDLTQSKITEALHKRLGGMLDIEVAAGKAAAAADDADDAGSGGDGVRLFRRGPAVRSVPLGDAPAPPQRRPKDAPGRRRRRLEGGGAAAEGSAALAARCAAAAVDGAAIEAGAAAAAAAAARHLMPVEPTEWDLAGRAKRRRMRRQAAAEGYSEGVPAAVILAAGAGGG